MDKYVSIIKQTADAISERLYDVFGGTVKVYTEQVRQGLSKPCFIVTALNSELKRQQANRWFLVNPFRVTYHSDEGDGGDRADIYEMQMRLYDYLSEVVIDGAAVRGTKTCCKVNNGNTDAITVLQDGTADCRLEFEANYDMYLTKAPEREIMGKLEVKLKGEF